MLLNCKKIWYFKCFTACGFPKTFALKDLSGQYYCLHQSTLKKERDCPEDFVGSNMHVLKVLSHHDDSSIPKNKCIIRSVISDEELVISENEELQTVADSEVSNSDRHFLAADVGKNHIIIFSYKHNKYLRSDTTGDSILIATETGDCGSDCHFVLENVNLPARRRKRGTEQLNLIKQKATTNIC